MRIIELPEYGHYASILVDEKYVGCVWLHGDWKLDMGERSWQLMLGAGDVFIHADAIRRK